MRNKGAQDTILGFMCTPGVVVAANKTMTEILYQVSEQEAMHRR